MIDENRTLQLYGYTSDELSPKSSKPIVAVCEECGKYRDVMKRSYRDLCNPCSVTGIKRSDETKQKLSESKMGDRNPNFGKKYTDDERISRSRALIGEKSPHWKGGTAAWRCTLLSTRAYKNWRAAVFERDEFACQLCGCNKSGSFQAHHIRPVRDHKNDLLVYDVDNGITLCRDCHESLNKKESDFINYFETIIHGGTKI